MWATGSSVSRGIDDRGQRSQQPGYAMAGGKALHAAAAPSFMLSAVACDAELAARRSRDHRARLARSTRVGRPGRPRRLSTHLQPKSHICKGAGNVIRVRLQQPGLAALPALPGGRRVTRAQCAAQCLAGDPAAAARAAHGLGQPTLTVQRASSRMLGLFTSLQGAQAGQPGSNYARANGG